MALNTTAWIVALMIGDGIFVTFRCVIVAIDLLVVVGFANVLFICPCLGHTMLIARLVVVASCLRPNGVSTSSLAG